MGGQLKRIDCNSFGVDYFYSTDGKIHKKENIYVMILSSIVTPMTMMDIAQRKKEIDRKIVKKTATEADMAELSDLIERDKKLRKKDKKGIYNKYFQDLPPLSSGELHD